jgi:hypothetical protein
MIGPSCTPKDFAAAERSLGGHRLDAELGRLGGGDVHEAASRVKADDGPVAVESGLHARHAGSESIVRERRHRDALQLHRERLADRQAQAFEVGVRQAALLSERQRPPEVPGMDV